MKILRDVDCDFELFLVAGAGLRGNGDGAGSSSFGHTRDHELVGADHHRTVGFAKANLRTPKIEGIQTGTDNADFTAGESRSGLQRMDMRLSVNVLLS